MGELLEEKRDLLETIDNIKEISQQQEEEINNSRVTILELTNQLSLSHSSRQKEAFNATR